MAKKKDDEAEKVQGADQDSSSATSTSGNLEAAQDPADLAPPPPAHHAKRFKVLRHLNHDNAHHPAGEVVQGALFSLEQIEALLKAGVIEEVAEEQRT